MRLDHDDEQLLGGPLVPADPATVGQGAIPPSAIRFRPLPRAFCLVLSEAFPDKKTFDYAFWFVSHLLANGNNGKFPHFAHHSVMKRDFAGPATTARSRS